MDRSVRTTWRVASGLSRLTVVVPRSFRHNPGLSRIICHLFHVSSENFAVKVSVVMFTVLNAPRFWWSATVFHCCLHKGTPVVTVPTGLTRAFRGNPRDISRGDGGKLLTDCTLPLWRGPVLMDD